MHEESDTEAECSLLEGKVERNRTRDLLVAQYLAASGIRVATFWECDIRNDLDEVVSKILNDVIFQDRQIDPVAGRLIHADLRRFAKGEKIEMNVPIHLVGEPEGLNEEGAVLSQAMREIKVLCEPAKTPDAIEADISHLTSEHALHVSDLKVGEGIEIHEAPETVVASIVIVKETELEPQLEEGGEPEVAGESKEEPKAE